MMFINMGKDFGLNKDGYVYALGTPIELDVTFSHPQSLYLARVAKMAVAEYSKYQYLSNLARDRPVWSSDPNNAAPLAGLSTFATGSAIYHRGIGRYLFLTGVSTARGVPNPHGTLYEAPQPWGPWHEMGVIPGVSISMLIAKDAAMDHVFFTSAGGTEPYQLNIGRIDFIVGSPDDSK